MKKAFWDKFMDKILIISYKANFMNIKIRKGKALTDFVIWFNKAAQKLKCNNKLHLIDLKNAMEHAFEPYQEPSIACISPLANATNLKIIFNS